MALRWYQHSCLDALLGAMGDADAVAQLPTGSGKSHVIAELARMTVQDYGARVLVLAHVKELLEQNRRVLHDLWSGAPSGYWCAGLGEKRARQITFGSIQSIYQATCRVGTYDLIIVDEAHLIPHRSTGMYRRFVAEQRAAHRNGLRVAGLTATPYRMTSGMLHEGEDRLFDALAYEQKIAPLVAEGWLSPLIGRHAENSVDMSGAHIRAGEFVAADEESAFRARVSGAVDEMLQLTDERGSILIFAATVAHAERVCAEIRQRTGRAPRLVTGQTPARERAGAVRDFRTGLARILVNVGVYTTGFDAPNVDAIVLMRATRSPGLYVQIAGRGLRVAPDKTDCLLLDYGGNIRRHGPLDEITARAAKRKVSETEPRSRMCTSCGVEISVTARICPHCGATVEREERRPRHDTSADTADPMTGVEEWLDVDSVTYARHKKKGKPDSMRATYFCGGAFGEIVSEWICFEHPGYAGEKARKWARLRGVFPEPQTVGEALEIRWRKPRGIKIKRKGRWPEIVDHEFDNDNKQQVLWGREA